MIGHLGSIKAMPAKILMVVRGEHKVATSSLKDIYDMEKLNCRLHMLQQVRLLPGD